MLNRFCLCSLFFISYTVFSQLRDHSVADLPYVIKPSIVSTHPFGILFSRWQGNFQHNPLERFNLQITYESGNVWSPFVRAYIPNDDLTRNKMRDLEWHQREFAVDVSNLDSKTLEAQFDGVIKGLRLHFNIPINFNSEIKLGLRSFLLTGGGFPFSVLTSDSAIEFFHDNIAGGSDPFDRKKYPFNDALIRYKDRNNRTMTLRNGAFVLSGFEISYYNYLKTFNKTLSLNYALHLGINTSPFNKTIDLGASANLIKHLRFKNKNTLSVGLSIGGTRNNLLALDDYNLDFSNNTYIGFLETMVQYSYMAKQKKTQHSFGINFYLQTSLNKKEEYDYIIPTRNGTAVNFWNTAIENLYRNNNYWTLMYSFSKKITTTFYLQQDLTVNNNPDIQTGISVSFNL